MKSERMTWNSVRQLVIRDVKGTLRCKNYFPNVTDLTISCRLNQTSMINNLKSIIPLDRLTKLVFHTYHANSLWLIKLLQQTPTLLTLEIDDVSLSNSFLGTIEEKEDIRLVSRINQVRNLIIHRYQICDMEFLINLFPRLHQLSLPLGPDPQKLLRTLFSNANHRLENLYLLHITNVSENDMTFLKKFIMEEKLLSQYSPAIQYNRLDNNMHFWW
jgi:hypothetical protein